MRDFVATLPRTEVLRIAIFNLIIVAFMASAWATWWKERTRTKN
ncbi:MAG: hypothetical protein AB7L09_26190 [Nitrospira sp.]